MKVRTSLKGIMARHKGRLVSKIEIQRGGNRLVNIPPKSITKRN